MEINNEKFLFSKIQIALLSPSAFKYFLHQNLPLKIEVPEDLNSNTLIDCFINLYSLFDSSDHLTISTKTLNEFTFLADFLDNRFLMKQCKKVCPSQPQIFSLQPKIFLCYPKSWLNKLADFDLKINNHQVLISYPLFSCICDKFTQSLHQEHSLSISIPNEYLNCFISFFDLMKGFSFNFDNYNYSNLKSLIDSFGITSLVQVMSEKVPFPESLEDSLLFRSQPCCEFLETHFTQSSFIIIQHFPSLSFEDLNQFPNSHLMEIFGSNYLQIENEDYLFNLIMKMIEEDKSRISLLGAVQVAYVSENLLNDFFEKISTNDIDLELLESMKKKIVDGNTNLEKLSQRWKTTPNSLSAEEKCQILNIIDSLSQEKQKSLMQSRLLAEQIKQLEKERLFPKSTTILYQNDPNGLLQNLIQNDSDQISLTCSNFYGSQYQPENLFLYDDLTCFCSKDEPNSWFCFQLKSKKIIPCGYLLRSYGNWDETPMTWVLEGSNDGVEWKIIHQRENKDWKTKSWSEVYFRVQTKEAFSSFKFTQNGGNYRSHIFLCLNYFELFGEMLNK
jgi:hypothetical protein